MGLLQERGMARSWGKVLNAPVVIFAMRDAKSAAEQCRVMLFTVTDQETASAIEKVPGALGPSTLAERARRRFAEQFAHGGANARRDTERAAVRQLH
jgi:hypothetical protein